MAFRFTEESDRFFDAILSLENKDECRKFFEDICTIKEIQDMQQRLTVAQMLDAGCVNNGKNRSECGNDKQGQQMPDLRQRRLPSRA